jgi:ribosome biogenesis GTPase
MLGRVIQEQKNYCLVDISQKEPVRAVLKGVAKNKQKRIAVGDFVEVELFDGIADNAIIRDVLERKNFLPKPLIANIDGIFFVNCFIEPALDLFYIDRFLFCAAAKNINVTLIFNKTDILTKSQFDELRNLAKIYEKIGFEVLMTSVKDEKSISKVAQAAQDRVSVFAGQSGVGKSSIMQILFPDISFIVQELSPNLLRGRNTTSHTSLLQLANGGFIADTPGFSFFEIPNIEPRFVVSCFPDFVKVLENSPCRFSNCSHKNEPECSIKSAVEVGEIYPNRLKSYMAIFDDTAAKAKNYNN